VPDAAPEVEPLADDDVRERDDADEDGVEGDGTGKRRAAGQRARRDGPEGDGDGRRGQRADDEDAPRDDEGDEAAGPASWPSKTPSMMPVKP